MDEDEEYSLHYEISVRITKADKNSVTALMKNELVGTLSNVGTLSILSNQRLEWILSMVQF